MRNPWHWGSPDRLPPREPLQSAVSALLGVPLTSLSPGEPVVPDPVVTCPLPFASADAEDRAAHTRGKSWPDLVRGFRGDYSTAPDVVLRPRKEADVTDALAWAESADVVVVPWGGGTSVTGGVECARRDRSGVAALDLAALDRVLDVNPTDRTARIEAGATGPSLEAQLAAHGMTLRHYPQSFEHSTLGGWIATRAGGHFATLYTHVDELVQSVRMVTPRGVWQSPRVPASGAGPSPDRFVLGSEGILGVITEAVMRVRPRPRWRASATVRFETFAAAVGAARRVVQAELWPANCRVLDPREAALHGVATSAVLLLGFESADHPVDVARAVDIAVAAGGVLAEPPVLRDDGAAPATSDGATSDGATSPTSTWRQAFFDMPYRQSALVPCGVLADTFETAVTWDRFPALHADVVASLRAALGKPCLVTCRLTHVYLDGPAPYYTYLAPSPDLSLARWQDAKAAASEALARHGATITHHHAVGRMHRPWYDRERPEPFALALAAAKAALDPAHILNPGVLLG